MSVIAIKRSISAPRDLFKLADARFARLGYKNFSQYVQALMESDVYYQGKESDFMHNRPLPRKPDPDPQPGRREDLQLNEVAPTHDLQKDTVRKLEEILSRKKKGTRYPRAAQKPQP